MLSRGLSSASSRSSQPKSLTYAQMHPQAPPEQNVRDPEIAHKQAIAAASFAFERASERALAAQGHNESNFGQAVNDEEQAQNAHRLGRKQSIRFTGSTAVPLLNRSITRRVAPDHNDLYNLPQDGSHATGAYISGHLASGTRKSPPRKGDSYGSRGLSATASYRKLKRARSMFSLRSSGPNSCSDYRPHKNPEVQRPSAGIADGHSQLPHISDSRLRRSFSFLRGEKDHMASGLDLHENKGAVNQLAREQYLRQSEEQKWRPQPSSLAASHHRKSQRTFRRSVRSSSTNSYGSAIASPPQVPKEAALKKGLGYKARSLSVSLKQKLKRVFHRPSELEGTLPIQQLDASRAHFGDCASTFTGVHLEYHHIPSPDSETLCKARSRDCSLRNMPGMPESGSPAKSIRSVQSEDGGSPPVISWANPIPGISTTSALSREKKRLSVIQEHGGPHEPSSTAHSNGEVGNVFRTPMRSSSASQQIEAYVDSHIIYSALQQKFYENRRSAEPEDDASQTGQHTNDVQTKPCKTPACSVSSQPHTKVSVDCPLRVDDIENSKSGYAERVRTSGMTGIICPPEEHSTDYGVQDEFLDMYTTLTPQQIAEHNESKSPTPKRPLREIKAAFFPSSMRIERTNISPYRRLMGSGVENEASAGSEVEENRSVKIRSESAMGSASIYSRTSSGNTPKENKSSLSLAKSESSHERGNAVIITTLPRQPEESFASLPRQSISLKKVGEQPNCVDSELSSFDKPRPENIGNFNTKKENRHKRENAQIDDDETDMETLRTYPNMDKQALGIFLGKAISQPNFRNQTSGPIFTRSPLLDMGQPAVQEGSEQSSPALPWGPTTPRKSLCGTHEKCPSSRRNHASTLPGRIASHGTPQGTDSLVNLDENMIRHGPLISTENLRRDVTQDTHDALSPAALRAVFRTNKASKSRGYNSPERLARLRRLRSSNSLTSQNKCHLASNIGQHEGEHSNHALLHSAFGSPPIKAEFTNNQIFSRATKGAQATGVHNMVDSFLSNRTRNTQMSDDNSMGPAFL